jgi:competence protein ComGC
MVDIDYGLLDELCAVDVITRDQADEVRSKRTPDSRVEQLLNFVVKMTDAQQEQFLVALDKTQQTHVSEYIRAGGNLKSLNKDNWPLLHCSEMRMLDKNLATLTEAIDLKCGLLDELFAEGCINRQQMKAIKTQRTDAAQNGALLNMMYRKSFADFNKLLRCLEKTKQSHVVSLLSSSYTCNDQPLSDALKSRLIKNHAILMELIDTRYGLLAELQASDCITRRQKNTLNQKTAKRDCWT